MKHTVRKALSLLLAFVMLCGLLIIPAGAEGTSPFSLKESTIKTAPGGNFTLTVNASDASQINEIEFWISCDRSVFTLDQAASDLNMELLDWSTGDTYDFYSYPTSNGSVTETSCELVNFTFAVSPEAAEGDYTFTVSGYWGNAGGSCTNFDDMSATVTVSNEPSWYGNGTATEYTISTADELREFAQIVNGTHATFAQDDFAGKTVILANDIALADDNLYTATENTIFGNTTVGTFTGTYYAVNPGAPIWTPIASGSATSWQGVSAANTFAGTFDGAGYTVSGVYTGDGTLDSANTKSVQGLFGAVSGTVKNVTVDGCITASCVAGGVVAYLTGTGTVENCVNRAVVFADAGVQVGAPYGPAFDTAPGSGAVGGVVGEIEKTTDAGVTVSKCTNYGTVLGAGTRNDGYVGGIVGRISANGSAVVTIDSCVNNGKLDANQWVGGILSYARANTVTISNCANTGSVTAHDANGMNSCVGGIVGEGHCNIANCYNVGAVSGRRYVGGIAGLFNTYDEDVSATNCYNTGTITGGEAIAGTGYGYTTSYLVNCYALNATNGGYATSKTADEMKSEDFVLALGGAYNYDSDSINGGYPVLAWQGGRAVAEVDTTIDAEDFVDGVFTISAGEVYTLSPGAAGTIEISTTDAVTISGPAYDDSTYTLSNSATAFVGVSITGVVAGIDLTVENLFITSGDSTNTYEDTANGVTGICNIINVQGAGNKLTLAGVNDLETQAGGAVIHVGPDAELTIGEADEGGTLYLYKSGAWTAIGGNGYEANGKITINGGTIFAKGTKMGAVIGSGSYCSATPGDVIINGGTLNLIANARGALIGTGAGSGTGGWYPSTGNVTINGGSINMNVDWTGAAIGASGKSSGPNEGAVTAGSLTVNGGSLRVFIDYNSCSYWGLTEAGVDPVGITAYSQGNVKNENSDRVYMCAVPTDGVIGSYTVTIDDEVYYEGGLHEYCFVQETLEKSQQQSISDTTCNWIPGDDDNLYFYLTGTDHDLDVNGVAYTATWDEATQTFTVGVSAPVWDGAAADSYADGSGTENDPYLIGTAEQLAYLAGVVNGGDSCEGEYFLLTSDIYLNSDDTPDANVWPAIGDATTAFQGTFDGGGHYVYNLYYYDPDTSSVRYKALFGNVGASGTIMNVGVTGTVGAYNYAAGIAGYNAGTITGCVNAANVTGNDSGTLGSGGIAGANAGTISECYNTGTIHNKYRPAGGIAGINVNFSAKIENCYSIGTVTSAAGDTYAGAITATLNSSTVSNCYYLTGSAPYAVAYPSSTTGVMNEADMKTADFAAALCGAYGRAFTVDSSTDPINNGFPILRWQAGEDTATVTSITYTGEYAAEYDEGDSFDPDTLVLWANYSDGTKETIGSYTLTLDGVEITGDYQFAASDDGKTLVLSVDYKGATCSIDKQISVAALDAGLTTVTMGYGSYTGDFASRVPYNVYNNYSFCESFYSAEEIGTAGTITQLAYQVAVADPFATESVKVYMGYTSDSGIDSWVPAEDLTLVYEGAPTLGTETGWEALTLDTPFYYNGKDNLIIAVSKTATVSTSPYSKLKYYVTIGSTASTGTVYRESSSDASYADYSNVSTAGRFGGNRPNTQLTLKVCLHENQSNLVREEATCTAYGYESFHCEDCGEDVTLAIPALGHTPAEGSKVEFDDYDQYTCSVCGETYIVRKDAPITITGDVSVSLSDGGAYEWEYDTENDRLRSTNYNVNSSTSATTITMTSDAAFTVSFDYAVSSEAGYDKLTITLDSTTVANAISGIASGNYASEELEAGTHTLVVSYVKDGATMTNDDRGYISNIAVTATASAPENVYGDVDGDGAVTLADYMLIRQYISGTADLDADQLIAADVDGDGIITLADYMLIRQYINGSITVFPVEE